MAVDMRGRSRVTDTKEVKAKRKRGRDKNQRYSDETDADRAALPRKYPLKYESDDFNILNKQNYIDLLTTDVERQLLRGIVSPQRIRDLLGLRDVRVIRSCIARVQQRWSVMGADRNRQRVVGETVARLDSVSEHAWSIANNPNNKTSDVLSALKIIATVTKTMADVRGVNPTPMVEIKNTQINQSTVSSEINKNNKSREIATRFNEVLTKNNMGGVVIENGTT